MFRSLPLCRKTSGARLLAKKVAGVRRGVGGSFRATRSRVLVEHRLKQLEEVSKETIQRLERLESSLDENIEIEGIDEEIACTLKEINEKQDSMNNKLDEFNMLLINSKKKSWWKW